MQLFLSVLLILGFLGGNVLRWQFGNGYAVMALDICVAITVFIDVWQQRKTLVEHPLVKPFALLIAILILSLVVQIPHLTTAHMLESFAYTVRFTIYSSLVFVSFKPKTYTYLFNILGIGTVALSLIQYMYYPFLRNLYYLGWDEHLYRAFGQFLDPNFLGIFLGMYLLFTLNALLQSPKAYWFYACSTTLTVMTLFLTYSRESYIVTLIGLLCFAVMKKILNIKLIAIVALICLGLFTGYTLFAHKSEGTKLLRTASIFQRAQSDQEALLVFAKNPILGVGFNAYQFARPVPFAPQNTRYPNHAASSPENSYLLILATTGLIGVGVYLFFWINVFQLGWRSTQKALLISTTVLFLASGFFINSLFYPLILVWFLSVMAAYGDTGTAILDDKKT